MRVASQALQGLAGGAAHRRDARLAALADDRDDTLIEINVPDVGTNEFRQPQPAAVEQLGDGAVAQFKIVLRFVANEELCGLVGIHRLRQARLLFRRANPRCRIAAKLSSAHQPRKEAPHAGQGAGDGARRKTASVQTRHVCANVMAANILGALRCVCAEAIEIASVGRHRVRRRLPFAGERREIAVDVGRECAALIERGGLPAALHHLCVPSLAMAVATRS